MNNIVFLELQKEWYEKLKDSGFKDIEIMDRNKMRLKKEHNRLFRKRSVRSFDMWESVLIEARITYYLNLTQKVCDRLTKFKRELDRIVMTMYSDGFNKSEISRFLEAFGYKRGRKSIGYLIRRYENEWGLKNYTLKQLNKRPRKAQATA